jgi:hypothetical protein
MKPIRLIALAAAALCLNAQGASKHDYVYTPAAGVHEMKYFHGCWDNKDQEKRPKIAVTMAGLATSDVLVETRQREEGKPSTEMITFRLKNMDASFSVQFRSKDGDHCQQGVASIAFRDKVLHNANEVNAIR